MDGFVNINKPEGITSYDVIRRLKKVLPRKTRLGHLGTLDPIAGGVLPVAIGKATRVIEYMNQEDKIYQAELVLGAVSDTEDSSGTITYTGYQEVQPDEVMQVLASMTGLIEQIPPMYSALHHQGKRLYELARQGITVELTPRQVQVYSLQLLSQHLKADHPHLLIQVSCSRGTYIRSLCRDIGEKLGTGAYMSGLSRRKSGIFRIEDSCSLEKIMDNPGLLEKILYPLDYPLQNLPMLNLAAPWQDNDIINGKALRWEEKSSPGMSRIYASTGNLLALAEIESREDNYIIRPKKVFQLE